MDTLSITFPDDWHCHLRDEAYLCTTVPHIALRAKRAIIMPNLAPPVVNTKLAEAYLTRIKAHIPPGNTFHPLMTLYLTQSTTPFDIQNAKASGIIYGCKLYPAGVTTHSEQGISSLKAIYPIFEALSFYQIPLLIHGETNNPEVDIFDRERIFIDTALTEICAHFPEMKIVLEHITTREAVQFVLEAKKTVAATITPHHLWCNRNDLLANKLNPHYYCLPILKRKEHQTALIEAATSGNPKFFIGTDSAPHPRSQKESACGCAGIYSAHAAIEMYAEIFYSHQALHRLEGFASHYGPDFYGLPRNKTKLELRKTTWTLPTHFQFASETLVPFLAGETLSWKASVNGETS